MAEMKGCLKCGHTRDLSDGDDVHTCPKCGAIYAKVEALAEQGKPIIPYVERPPQRPLMTAYTTEGESQKDKPVEPLPEAQETETRHKPITAEEPDPAPVETPVPDSTPAPRPRQSPVAAEPEYVEEKSLGMAIGLNFIVPGFGYLYMSQWTTGVLCLLIVGGILSTTGLLLLMPTWLVLNVIMTIDMLMLHKKHRKTVKSATMMSCPDCAEMIKREAKVCRYCRAKLA